MCINPANMAMIKYICPIKCEHSGHLPSIAHIRFPELFGDKPGKFVAVPARVWVLAFGPFARTSSPPCFLPFLSQLFFLRPYVGAGRKQPRKHGRAAHLLGRIGPLVARACGAFDAFLRQRPGPFVSPPCLQEPQCSGAFPKCCCAK